MIKVLHGRRCTQRTRIDGMESVGWTWRFGHRQARTTMAGKGKKLNCKRVELYKIGSGFDGQGYRLYGIGRAGNCIYDLEFGHSGICRRISVCVHTCFSQQRISSLHFTILSARTHFMVYVTLLLRQSHHMLVIRSLCISLASSFQIRPHPPRGQAQNTIQGKSSNNCFLSNDPFLLLLY